MDFVSQLIQEGYNQEDVSVILEAAYLIETNGGGNIFEEVEYITEVRGLLLAQLAKLKKLPQSPAIQRQIQRLQRMLGGKADDVARTTTTKADDAVKTTRQTSGRITGDVVDDATKAGTKVDDAVKAGTNKKPPGKWSRRTKATAALMAGAAGYGLLTGDGKNGSGSNDGDTPGGDTPGGPGSDTPGGPGSDTPGGDNKTGSGDNKTGSGNNSGKPKGKFWHSTLKPKSLGYQMQPSVSSYRNIRSHRELQGKIINESHAIILDYLITEGHASDIDEANYVMMQLDFDHIQEIINENI